MTCGGTSRRRLDELARAWAFGRHIPPRKLLRRFTLTLTRLWRDRVGWPAPRAAAPAPAMSAAPPWPLFPPRPGGIARSPDGFVFTFLGHAHRMRGVIDWNAPGPSAAWQLWRMNLHYMDYLESVDDTLFVALVSDWIAANTSDRPGAWKDSWNAYALSIRVVVWMGEIARRRLAPADLIPILESLVAQLRFLENALETDIGGNHLVKNIKALLWASVFFQGHDAARWRRLGLKTLRLALREQILPDGMHYERSPSYHGQVFADLLACRHVLGGAEPECDPASRRECDPASRRERDEASRRERDEASRRELDETLRAMAVATADLAHPDGYVAQFNDAGLTMAHAPTVCLAVFATMLGHPPCPRTGFAFPAAGYYGLRTGDDYLVVDCGRIAPDDLPAHGHGDVLSLEWSVAGQRIVVDQGVFEYVAGARRRLARSAVAHNTLCFEDADQADFHGAFRCGRRPGVTIRRLDIAEDHLVLEGTHDGFRHLPGAPRHVRHIEAEAGVLRIVDRIEGDADRGAHIGFLLHPDVRAACRAGGLSLTRGGVTILVGATAGMTLRDAVYWPDMGIEKTTKRISITVDRGMREVITTWRVVMPGPSRTQEIP